MKKELSVPVKNYTDVLEEKKLAYLKRLSVRLKKKFNKKYRMGDVVEVVAKGRQVGLLGIGVICGISSGHYTIDFGYGEHSWFSDWELKPYRFEQVVEMVPPPADMIESVEKIKNWMKENRLTSGVFMGMEVKLP